MKETFIVNMQLGKQFLTLEHRNFKKNIQFYIKKKYTFTLSSSIYKQNKIIENKNNNKKNNTVQNSTRKICIK